jgi:hypothetical protein
MKLKRLKPSGFLKKNIVNEPNCMEWTLGTCLTCIKDFSFCEHRQEEKLRSGRLSCLIAESVKSSKSQALERISARNEFESDEFETWQEKSQNYIK